MCTDFILIKGKTLAMSVTLHLEQIKKKKRLVVKMTK